MCSLAVPSHRRNVTMVVGPYTCKGDGAYHLVV